MKKRFFTKTFFRFLFGFGAILVFAFGVFIAGAQFAPGATTAAVAQ